MDGYTLYAGQTAREARVEARGLEHARLEPAALRIGKVMALQDGGTYRAAELGDDGTTIVAVWDRVRCVPAAGLGVDQVVWLVFWPGYGMPVILETSGGGGAPTGYLQGVADLGFAGCGSD